MYVGRIEYHQAVVHIAYGVHRLKYGPVKVLAARSESLLDSGL